MGQGYCRVMILGDVAAEPEVYVTRSGMVVMTIDVASTEPYVDKDDVVRERTQHTVVVMLGKRADTLSKVLRRGSRVFVEGTLRTSSFEGRDGKKWTKTEVMASEILFAGEERTVAS